MKFSSTDDDMPIQLKLNKLLLISLSVSATSVSVLSFFIRIVNRRSIASYFCVAKVLSMNTRYFVPTEFLLI